MSGDGLPLSWWNWQGEDLQLADEEVDLNDALQLTSVVVDQIRACSFNDARRLIEERKDIVRLICLKELREKGEATLPKLDLTRQQKLSALAAYLTIGKENSGPCQQCLSWRSRGPCVECVAGGKSLFNGACTNCQFSSSAGTGRKTKKRSRSPSCEATPSLSSLTPEAIRELSTRELERWMNMITNEIALRQLPYPSEKRRRA
ncbi:hypothetical protein F4811DRAFT_558628 [Daldinia bambusicola]|nr:hypothetical protein F4811DRAFT_558628 [Daldinia bambusicola]